jgi:hypothetical protein
MTLTEAVTEAVSDPADPAATLALAYADAIDQATHVPLGLADALDTLAAAAAAVDIADGSDDATRAHRKVAAALSAVTVLGDLGPRLLAALDALTLTPKARAALSRKLDDAARPASPLDALRDRHDSRHLRAAG